MLIVQRILLNIVSFVCFFVGGVLISDQINEDAHDDIKLEMNHIIHHLIPISRGTPYPILIRLIIGLTILIVGCVMIWFERKRQSSLLILLMIMLSITVVNAYFEFVFEVPVTLSGILVVCLYLDGIETKQRLKAATTKNYKKID